MAAAIAVGVNSVSLLVLSRPGPWGHGPARRNLLLHSTVIVPGWLWFAGELLALSKSDPREGERLSREALGWSLLAAGWLLVAAGFRTLGPGAVINADLFATNPQPRTRDGVYRLLSQPIYTGYGLLVVGGGLARSNPILVALGGWLAFLLLLVQAPAEDLAFRRRSSSDA